MPEKLFFVTNYLSPIGSLTIVLSTAGLYRLSFPGEEPGGIRNYLIRKFPGTAINIDNNDRPCAEVIRQLDDYFNGRRFAFSLPLDLYGTPFQVAVWSALQRIPYGATCSYSYIAGSIDRPSAVRAVGQAIGRNPVGIIIPCHRVIGKDGRLVGFGGGLSIKEWLLNFEAGNIKA
ncbi:methylated-DNA--[protein]-cysteine S-methyltransferase [Moorella sulfitireducens]|uniref:methylated-DNA--[protein]-cysteine S-methyltransferase n=1 Tax=Neomoorella sulfitireducens TaxID=2972948 RepID=UPI0021ACB42F|nr:methylated-DNA--[protein]-cysteine S-methyltransferase [Moorella sulfitireducens]